MTRNRRMETDSGRLPVSPRSGRFRRRRGIALLLTLLVLAILVILVTQLRLSTHLHVVQARNVTGDLQNMHGALAALEFARLYVQTDTELAPTIDTLQEPWARPHMVPGLVDAAVQYRIEDEERRFNLGLLVLPDGKPNPVGRDQLRRLVAILGIPDETLADRIADYIDPDSEGDFEAGAKNRPLVIPEEMAMIPGVMPEHLYGGVNPQTGMPFRGILEYVTLWPVPRMGVVTPDATTAAVAPPADGTTPPPAPPPPPPVAARQMMNLGVNVNTAPAEVLLALSPDMTPDIAQAIVAFRMGMTEDGKPCVFNSIPDLYRVPGMTEKVVDTLKGSLVFKSTFFSVRVTCRSRNVTRRVRYVLARGFGGVAPPIVTWWEEGGAFGLPQLPQTR